MLSGVGIMLIVHPLPLKIAFAGKGGMGHKDVKRGMVYTHVMTK